MLHGLSVKAKQAHVIQSNLSKASQSELFYCDLPIFHHILSQSLYKLSLIFNIQTVLNLLLTVRFDYISDAEDGKTDVKNADHLFKNCSHRTRVSIQQAADGRQGDGPIVQSAAYEYRASSEEFFLFEVHVEETSMLISLGVISL